MIAFWRLNSHNEDIVEFWCGGRYSFVYVYPKVHLKIDQPHNHNPKYQQLYAKRNKEKKKKKREELE